jgi:hypothetical protein
MKGFIFLLFVITNTSAIPIVILLGWWWFVAIPLFLAVVCMIIDSKK